MPDRWEVALVDPDVLGEVEEEPLGTKEKFWVQKVDDNSLWLFKFAREVDGRILGEDWAEWVVHQLAKSMGIPTAEVQAAECAGRRGIVSRNVVPDNSRLVHGNSLLVEKDVLYNPNVGRHNPGYRLNAVYDALHLVNSPAGYPALKGLSGFDVWVGYVLLDALVAGRDRHHENWGILSQAGSRSLAPSFDHGNALGFQETDAKRLRCLNTPELLANWALRGKSHHFVGQPNLVSLACDAVAMASSEAACHWRDSLNRVTPEIVSRIVEAVPETVMSAVTRSFIVELVTLNRRRLLDAYPLGK